MFGSTETIAPFRTVGQMLGISRSFPGLFPLPCVDFLVILAATVEECLLRFAG
jgi:hypothetical protein